jgi:serine/threonine protein kinase
MKSLHRSAKEAWASFSERATSVFRAMWPSRFFPIHLDRLSRFQREAQVLASLNHPHIAQIYGLEQAGNSTCIVMELVDGETLALKTARGPIPPAESVQIANQIIDTLEAAHDRNVVHRDLKPANIKMTIDGRVKVLDFGLAKALACDEEQVGASHSPTRVSGSMAGMIMGTAAYMSPEQARGKTVDARTDISAFGCVLYEMLTGQQVFPGETATEIIAKVLEREPDWLRLPAETLSSIRLLLQTLLHKDPKRRLRSIVDARPFLNAPVEPEAAKPLVRNHRKERHAWIVTAVLAVAFVSALVPSVLRWTQKPAEPPQLRFEMPALALSLNGLSLAISPDGQRLAYTATTNGKTAVWLRPLGSLIAPQLPGTEGGGSPFWSPDSRYLEIPDGRPVEFRTASCRRTGPCNGGSR